MNEIQKIILTCLLGPEDPNGFKNFCARKNRVISEAERTLRRDRESRRYWSNPALAASQTKERRKDHEWAAEQVARTNSWRAKNHGRWLKTVRTRDRIRMKSDPQYKLGKTLRSRIRCALRTLGGRKANKTQELIGAPVVWLEAWLESQFKPGMTWDNHGPVWHVDHIKPCAAFDLTDPEQQKICFHWSNLQPLFAPENLQKSDKYVM